MDPPKYTQPKESKEVISLTQGHIDNLRAKFIDKKKELELCLTERENKSEADCSLLDVDDDKRISDLVNDLGYIWDEIVEMRSSKVLIQRAESARASSNVICEQLSCLKEQTKNLSLTNTTIEEKIDNEDLTKSGELLNTAESLIVTNREQNARIPSRANHSESVGNSSIEVRKFIDSLKL